MPHWEFQPQVMKAGVSRVGTGGRAQPTAAGRGDPAGRSSWPGAGSCGWCVPGTEPSEKYTHGGSISLVLQCSRVLPTALHAQGCGQQPVVSVRTRTGGLQSGPHTCPSQSPEPGGDRGAFSLQAQQPRGPRGRAGCASRTLWDRDQVSGQTAGHLGAAQHPWQHPEQEMMVAGDRQ